MIALPEEPTELPDDTEKPCVARPGPDGDGLVTAVLHESVEEFGAVRLVTLGATTRCPWQFTHTLKIELEEPDGGVGAAGGYQRPELNADLLGTEASRIAGDWPGRGYRGVTSEASSPTAIFYQAWEVPADFVVTGLRVQIGSRFWTVAIEPPPLGPHIAEDAHIVVRVASDTGGVLACLQRGGMEPVCPESSEAAPDAGGADGWSWSSMLQWGADVPAEALVAVGAPLPSCSIVEELGELAWQMTSLGDNGTAVYVGRDQFITSERLFSDATPWGVASRGEVSLPVIRVASDTRNGLVLVEVIGGRTATGRRDPAPFAAATADSESSAPVLVAYPWGDADRFALTRLRVSEVSERLIRHNGWGWDRAGAPMVDPCTAEVVGVSTGRSEALRAETVKAVLEELRARRAMPVISNRGPSLHGSIALLPHPVYLGTEQPDFGGWICNVRPLTRYEVIYAVYLVSDSSPHITGTVGGKRARFSLCGWTDRIFILEYRSDETPSAVCAARGSRARPARRWSLSCSRLRALSCCRRPSWSDCRARGCRQIGTGRRRTSCGCGSRTGPM